MDKIEQLISVIVPVYNVEQYLRQCIDSILAQTYTNFELILVDDGSPDDSGIICDEYAQKDRRVIVIHQDNAGAASARNAALDVAEGKYIAFIDSDDLIHQKYLERLLESAVTNNADIAMCQLAEFEDVVPECDVESQDEYVFTGREASLLRYEKPEWITVGPPCKLFSSKLFETLRFPVGKLKEDNGTIPYAIYFANKVTVSNVIMYYYRNRPGSLERSVFDPQFFDDVQHMNNFIAFLEANRETTIAKAARKRRHLRLAIYTLQARVAGVTNIPEDCRMNILTAMVAVRNNFSHDRFCWYVHKLYPALLRPYLYFYKIETLVKKRYEENKHAEEN